MPPPTLLEQVVPKLLDWPPLAFVLLMITLVVLRPALAGALSRGDFSLSWGDRTLKLKNLSAGLDKELDPIRDELDNLKRALTALEAGSPDPPKVLPPAVPATELTPEARNAAAERIEDGLTSGRYVWRSVERLATIAGIDVVDCLEILRQDSRVVLSMGKSGQRIAKLKTR